MADYFNNTLESALHADAIISRGFTALTLNRMGIPYAELKTTGYDVIAAVDRCLRQHPCKKIAIVGAFNMVYGSESIRTVYRDIKIVSYTTENELELEALVKQAIDEGAEALVGGCSTVALATKLGVPGAIIESGKEAINNAIEDAIKTVNIARREQQKSSQIANIMNYSFQGILSTDPEGMITLANRSSLSLLDPNGDGLLGKQISGYFPAIRFRDVIDKGEKILSEMHRVGNVSLLVNCVPIEDMERSAGCVLTFQNITQIQEDEGKIRKRIYKKGFVAKYSFENIRCADPATHEVIRIATHFSKSDSNLLILGETGVGKELFAQSVHSASRRRSEPFVAINCAALPEELLESELFGYVEGAFTGAVKGGKMGLFEIAHRGTIFLDEIGDISARLQGRLLRVLQEREIIRLGHDTVIPIDVRVIAATNKDLQEEVRLGHFRQDLLYRLDVLRLCIPPMRQRRADIPCLIDYFIGRERQKTGCSLERLEPAAMEIASLYDWPGNVREIHNFCERICVLCTKASASATEVANALGIQQSSPVQKQSALTPEGGANHALAQTERELILQTLQLCGNNRKKASAALKMDPSTLWRKMKKYGLL